VEASARNRMAVLATPLYLLGVVIVGASGPTIRTTAGMESGWISAIVIVSPYWLMVPVDRTGWWWMMGTRCLLGHRGPGER
jgi:hypothetical protein